ncbi:branched-chain amino acid ABC transporter permease [Asanoa siamensis]|uniref:Branched-chain amino acid ABC transporter permease n=1 Tax=Asanoa siamensis TaxID=926357 RepID=A0ABQ4CJJ3_9ACTN|nr:branched-chain amino acid ABC transporter permease [Asanoa siamensis]GIF71443.1 branched-chain amino acid ABC transporter permease [Asanoa siamensis]
MTAVQAALSGALIGGLYALMAAGLSVTWGALRVINLAHFGLILVGAYLTYQLTTAWGIDPVLTLLVSAPVLFVAGAALQWAYDRLNIVEFNSLLVSFGLLMITIELTTQVWTADFRHIDAGENPYGTSAVHLGSIALPISRLVALGFAVLLIGGGHLVLERTFAGRGLRAFAQDRTVAASFGIDHRRLGMVVGGLAGVSAAVAGMVFALGNTIAPAHAYEWFGTVFAVVILGGIGNLLGSLFAGLGVGAFSAVVAVLWDPSYEPFVLFLAIILALVLRPKGLFTRRAAA